MGYFVDVLLPIPLERNFTYSVNAEEKQQLEPGMRIAVPFGKSKLYTGIVLEVHQRAPEAYEAKEIYRILDESPLVSSAQLEHWNWIAHYYMCTLGEVFRSAVPSVFLLESETRVRKGEAAELQQEPLNDPEYLILEALEHQEVLSVTEISEIIDRKQVLPLLNRMLGKGAIRMEERLQKGYTPKKVRYLRLHPDYREEPSLQALLDSMSRAPAQSRLILQLFQLQQGREKPIKSKELEERAQSSRSVIRTLLDKDILQEYYLEEDRVIFDGNTPGDVNIQLNEEQQQACDAIRSAFATERVTLLHGVTASGKTEVYIELIREFLRKGKQVLYLVPEIALTAQLTSRLQLVFGQRVVVFHSRQNQQERAEIWYHVRQAGEKASVILGARSALFLPFSELGLVIIDEEHENTYKQFDPAPRYHARDAAIVLAKSAGASVLLGSATPSIESFHNAQNGKYGYARLSRRYSEVLLPEMELVDLAVQYRKKRMTGHFSERLLEEIRLALQAHRQIILFQNRRGFAPVVECKTCGHAPQCPNCDVSLTFHQRRNELRCHYCGFHKALDPACEACGNPTLDTKGLGTEQVETELSELFPEANLARMDLDTTRGKYAYQQIISEFEAGEIDILVGTQMLSKGLDFRNVALVGVMNADSLLNFPHFRAHERCFQLLTQVAGRAGRTAERGKVIIQTYNPYHQILKQVAADDFEGMFRDQLYEREQFHYPPAVRIIKITFRHKEYNRVGEGAAWFAKFMRQLFGEQVLGPEFPPIARIRNQYHKNILLKIPSGQSLSQTKNSIKRIERSFNAISQYRSIRLIYNVDYI